MNLVRKYKISKVINVPLTGAEGEAIKLIESWLSNLTLYTLANQNQFISFIYYMSSDGDYVIEHEPTMGGTYIRNFGFWETLHEDYNIPHDDIAWVLRYILSRKFPDMHIKDLTPSYVLRHQKVEDMYNDKSSVIGISSRCPK